MENEIVEVQAERNLTAPELKAQVNLIQQVMGAVMKPDVHYGIVPGTDKPTLLKAGSEKLLMTFRIAPDLEGGVEDLSGPDERRYRVTSKAISILSGKFLGSGVGECSTEEEKYKWKKAICEAEYDATPEDRRRLKWYRDGNSVKQIRTNPADLANTVLKMAKKRSLSDLTLTVTAASDVFDQDLDDLDPSLRQDNGQTPQGPSRAPRRASGQRNAPQAPTPQEAGPESVVDQIDCIPEKVTQKSGTNKNNKPYTKYTIYTDKGNYGTFSSTHAQKAKDAIENGCSLTIRYKSTQYGNDILDGDESIEAFYAE